MQFNVLQVNVNLEFIIKFYTRNSVRTTYLEHATIKIFGRFLLYLTKLFNTLLYSTIYTVGLLQFAIEYYTALYDTVL